MYKVTKFVPRATTADIELAKKTFPFLQGINIEVVTDAKTALKIAVRDVDASLDSQNCVTGVESVVEVENGWQVKVITLD